MVQDNTMTENGEEEQRETNTSNMKKKQLGGIKTIPFIFANEICDRFANVGFHANLITYLTQELNLPLVMASNILTNFSGTLSLMLLTGAVVADSFAGRYQTIVAGGIIYEIGLLCMTATAVLPHFRPPPCPTQENCKQASGPQLAALYLSFLLTSLGVGAIRPSVITFAADQFNLNKLKKKGGKWNFFNWYNFGSGISLLLGLTLVVYVQDHVGWGWGLGIPSIAFAFSVVAFVAGSKLYKKVKPGGSPLVRLGQVIVAAVRKRNAVLPNDSSLLYENKELDARLSFNGRLLHTNQLRWLDRAAIVTDGDTRDSTRPNLWKISTVHRVEELKTIIRMLPIWGAAILLLAATSHSGSFTILQARTMDRHMSPSFKIPPASLTVFTILVMLAGIPLYDRIFVPFARRYTGNPTGITTLQRIGVGYGLNVFSTACSALIEAKRRKVAAHYNLLDKPTAVVPISVFWLLPQYIIDGIGDIFWSAGNLEFLYDQAPESMRSTTLALYWLVVSVGNYLGTFMVTLVHKYSGNENWLPDRNLNRGKLDHYYWLVCALSAITFIYFVICAWFYTYKPLEDVPGSSSEEEVELAAERIQPVPSDDVDENGRKELARIENN
ncbi:hypothetical protein LguiB_033362 [Lonicera macranthoides]